MINGNVAKLNQILSQNIEMKSAISSINTEITSLKSSLQFMDGTIDKLKEGVCQRAEVGLFEAFKNNIMDKLDDLENREKRNNLVFWNIPEKSEDGIGCKNLICNILHYHSKIATG